MTRPSIPRRTVLAAGAAGLAAASGLARAQQGPIRIGSTLALTGPLSATALVHKLVGEIYIEQVNARGGWLGRKLEWDPVSERVKDDDEANRLLSRPGRGQWHL